MKIRTALRRLRAARVLSAVVVLALAGSVAVAMGAIPNSTDGTVHLCYDSKDATGDRGGADLSIIDGQANTKGCSLGQSALTINQRGRDGTNGTNGVSGYKLVKKVYDDVPLPIDVTDFTIDCPDGRSVLGGGGFVLLGNASPGFAEVGSAPVYSNPLTESTWDIGVRQPITGVATKADIILRATCATVSP